jgi:hypothetical protein
MKELTDKQIGFILYVLQTILEKLEEEIIAKSTVVRRTSTGSSLQVPNELGEVYFNFLQNSNDIATFFFTMTDSPLLKKDIIDFISENNDALYERKKARVDDRSLN